MNWWLRGGRGPSLLSPCIPPAAQAGPLQCHSPGNKGQSLGNEFMRRPGDMAGMVSGLDLQRAESKSWDFIHPGAPRAVSRGQLW